MIKNWKLIFSEPESINLKCFWTGNDIIHHFLFEYIISQNANYKFLTQKKSGLCSETRLRVRNLVSAYLRRCADICAGSALVITATLMGRGRLRLWARLRLDHRFGFGIGGPDLIHPAHRAPPHTTGRRGLIAGLPPGVLPPVRLRFVRRHAPLNRAGRPAQTCAKAHKHQLMPRLHLARFNRFAQGNRNARRTRIALALQVHKDFIFRNLQLL